jgi:hypothetical protein
MAPPMIPDPPNIITFEGVFVFTVSTGYLRYVSCVPGEQAGRPFIQQELTKGSEEGNDRIDETLD